MKKILLSGILLLGYSATAQYNNSSVSFDIPYFQNNSGELDVIGSGTHGLYDMNGDGIVDMVDGQENGTGSVWGYTGSTRYWKVYLGTGSGFSSTAVIWNIPNFENNSGDLDNLSGGGHSLIDMNGDGKVDLVDAQENGTSSVWGYTGSTRYWKVYLNTGTGFSTSALNWNIPNFHNNSGDLDAISGATHAVLDMNNDGFVDLVDGQENGSSSVWGYTGSQRYWKVYLGDGTGFNSSATTWDIPNFKNNSGDLDAIYGADHSVIDINGDGKMDLVDAQQNGTSSVWGYTGAQRYWKVYLGTGTGFNSSSINWNIPNFHNNSADLDAFGSLTHGLYDMNGDGEVDLVDGQQTGTSSVWGYTGAQRYWKVYYGNGTGFNSAAVTWNVPNFENNSGDLDVLVGAGHALVDMNGDRNVDLVDCQENGSASVWGYTGATRYWKVYFVENVGMEDKFPNDKLTLYPNPSTGSLSIVNPFELANLRIFNLLGELIIDTQINNGLNQIDLNMITNGIYVVHLVEPSTNSTIVTKLEKI